MPLRWKEQEPPVPGMIPKAQRVAEKAKLIQRSGPPKRRRREPRTVEAVRDDDYKDFVRHLPCLLAERGECWESDLRDPDHAGKKTAMGRVEDDTSCIPLCRRHHSDRHDHRGYFKLWDGERMQKWRDEKIAETRARYDDYVLSRDSHGSRRSS